MSDLISRQDAIRLAEQGQIQGFEWQFKKLCELPSAQPEIIRCKNCRHNGSYDTDCPISWPKDDDDFCSYSER